MKISEESTKSLVRELEERVNQGKLSKGGQHLLAILSAVPEVGGVFGAAGSLWSAHDQSKINELFLATLQEFDGRLTASANKADLVQVEPSSHIVIGTITFNPNALVIYSSSSVSSITDNGPRDFTINFLIALDDYVFTVYGSGPVTIRSVNQTAVSMRVVFEEPAPDRVTFVFVRHGGGFSKY